MTTSGDKNDTKRRPRRWSLPPAMLDVVRDLADRGYTGKEVLDQLAADERSDPNRLPKLRTIQRAISDMSSTDSGDWSFGQGDPDDDRLVLETLAAVTRATKRRTLTQAEAGWAARIRRARPDLTPWQAFRFARRYVEWRARNEPTTALDAQLATMSAGEIAAYSDDTLDALAPASAEFYERILAKGAKGPVRALLVELIERARTAEGGGDAEATRQ